MKESKVSLQSSWLFVIVIAFGLIYLGGSVWSASNTSKKTSIQVNNHTQALQVVNTELHQGHIKLTLRNDSQKNVTAFVLSLPIAKGDVFAVKEEFAYSEADFVIGPGEAYEKSIPIPSSLRKKGLSVDLLAVVFDDRSSEGDQQVVQEIWEERFGEKIQLQRTISLLDKVLTLEDDKVTAYFTKDLKREFVVALSAPETEVLAKWREESARTMSRRVSDKVPEQINNGLHSGREYVFQKLKALEDLQHTQDGRYIRDELKEVKQTCEKIARKL